MMKSAYKQMTTTKLQKVLKSTKSHVSSEDFRVSLKSGAIFICPQYIENNNLKSNGLCELTN